MNRFFNTENYLTDPIEPVVVNHYASINMNFGVINNLYVKKHYGIGTNSYFTNSIDKFNSTYY